MQMELLSHGEVNSKPECDRGSEFVGVKKYEEALGCLRKAHELRYFAKTNVLMYELDT